MKLLFAPTSPFVRKCLICAAELKLLDRIELERTKAHPIVRDAGVIMYNPLEKIPALLTDDGQILYDSRVICEYLNHLGQGNLFPEDGHQRWQALTMQALADGMMDACVLARYEETIRPEELRWSTWSASQIKKASISLRELENNISTLHPDTGSAALSDTTLDIGSITVSCASCALWYIDLRFTEMNWRQHYPQVAKWYEQFTAPPSISMDWSNAA